jgi:hypothetical protein
MASSEQPQQPCKRQVSSSIPPPAPASSERRNVLLNRTARSHGYCVQLGCLTSSLSGLFRDTQGLLFRRQVGLSGCPRVTVTVPGRPPERARGGHDRLIHPREWVPTNKQVGSGGLAAWLISGRSAAGYRAGARAARYLVSRTRLPGFRPCGGCPGYPYRRCWDWP